MQIPTFFCFLILGTLGLASGSCGTPPYQKALPAPGEIKGKSQAWFEESWGKPGAKSQRFFGGETWVYFSLDGGTALRPFSNVVPAECQIRLDFDEEGKLQDSGYSGC